MDAFSGVHSVDGEFALGGDLGSLAAPGGSLRITGNPSLVQLRHSTLLSAVNDIVITDNPNLPSCEAHLMVDAFIPSRRLVQQHLHHWQRRRRRLPLSQALARRRGNQPSSGHPRQRIGTPGRPELEPLHAGARGWRAR